MYCSTCGVAVAQGLSFCNYCGAKLGGADGVQAAGSPEVKPGLLVSAMTAGLSLGLVAIAVLVGVLKAVAGFDTGILLAVTILSFLMLLMVEGVLIGLLLKGRRGAKAAGGAGRLKEQTTKALGDAPSRVLTEPAASVTEHTTRTLEPVYVKRQPE